MAILSHFNLLAVAGHYLSQLIAHVLAFALMFTCYYARVEVRRETLGITNNTRANLARAVKIWISYYDDTRKASVYDHNWKQSETPSKEVALVTDWSQSLR